jgi:ABC-type uncharacterized transport system permease subunit
MSLMSFTVFDLIPILLSMGYAALLYPPLYRLSHHRKMWLVIALLHNGWTGWWVHDYLPHTVLTGGWLALIPIILLLAALAALLFALELQWFDLTQLMPPIGALAIVSLLSTLLISNSSDLAQSAVTLSIHTSALHTTFTEWFHTHLLLSIAAYAVMLITWLHALLMQAQKRHLRDAKLQAHQGLKWLGNMPSVIQMQRILGHLLSATWLLISTSLVSGMVMQAHMTQQWLVFNHKTIFSWLAWLIVTVLCVGHWRGQWDSKTQVRWVTTSFICLLLSYLGVQAVKVMLR